MNGRYFIILKYFPNFPALHVHSTAPLDTDSLVSCPGFRYVPRGVDLRDGLVCQRAWVSSLSSSLVEQHTSYGLEMSRAINQLVQGQTYQFR